MIKGQTSRRDGIQDLLCPVTDLRITQGSGFNGGTYSHNGTGAIDTIGIDSGVKYPYYAPCDLKCVKVYPQYCEAHWQSLEKVRYANGTIDYITIMTCHDETINFGEGFIVHQGEQLGNMGAGGNATGVHCHIEQAYGQQTDVHKNEYGIWCFYNELEFEDSYFMDNTNIILGVANWKYLPTTSTGPEEPTTPTKPDTGTNTGDTDNLPPSDETPVSEPKNSIIEQIIEFILKLLKGLFK